MVTFETIVHAYKEEWADDLYAKLPQYLELFQELLEKLKKPDV